LPVRRRAAADGAERDGRRARAHGGVREREVRARSRASDDAVIRRARCRRGRRNARERRRGGYSTTTTTTTTTTDDDAVRRCRRGRDAHASAREVRLGDAMYAALRPRGGTKPGVILRAVVRDGFGSAEAKVEKRVMARALGLGRDDWERSVVFRRFHAMCDQFGRGTVRLCDFWRACASVRCGALWTPTRLDAVIDPVTRTVRWKRLSDGEIRSVFAFLMTSFDEERSEIIGDMDYETFARDVERGADLSEAYALCDEIMSIGTVAGQLLEILNDAAIDTFSDDTEWIGGSAFDAGARLSSSRTESGSRAASSPFAREAEIMTAAIRACKLNRAYEIEHLVDTKGLDVDARDETSDQQTLLMIAAANGNKATCKKLLVLGANPAARDVRGRTAVDIAGKYNHFTLAEYLRTHGVPLGVETSDENASRRTPRGKPPSGSLSEASHYKKKSGNDAKADFNGDEYVAPSMASPSAPPMEVEPGGGARGGESELLTPE